MPFYDYKCQNCKNIFEIIKGMNEVAKNVVCPNCSSNSCDRVFTPIKRLGAEHRGSGCSSCSNGVCSSCNCKS